MNANGSSGISLRSELMMTKGTGVDFSHSHSGLTPEAFTTLVHFTISDLM